MIELVYSNKTERLLEALANRLQARREAGVHPLEAVELVVPNRNMETWVRLELAQQFGVAANLRFRWLNLFFADLVGEFSDGEIKLADLDTVEAALLSVFMDNKLLSRPDMQPVRSYLPDDESSPPDHLDSLPSDPSRYLAADGTDLRRLQLAARMAFLYQEYSFSRPEMIASWRGEEWGGFNPEKLSFSDPMRFDQSLQSTVTWQRLLWQTVFARGGILDHNRPPEGGRWITMDQLAFNREFFKKIGEGNLPPVHIFGVSYVARLFQLLFARLGEVCDLHIYAFNPCAEFWEDVETDREFFYRLDRELNRRSKRIWNGNGEGEDEDPFGLFVSDTPALRYWGRPGREYLRLLGELTECDFTSAFEDPLPVEGGGLLHCLQRHILTREPERNLEDGDTESIAADQTIRLIAAPSVRREVEWIADEIWRLMESDRPEPGQSPLRFSDVAIIVNSAGRDIYLPQIETVFAASHNLPNSISDLPGSAGSRLVEAMGLLLELPFGRFSRAEVLALIAHPSIIGRFDGLTAEDLAARAEMLGIVFGADHSDHAGTYIDEDVFNWDQGLRRLALGAFMTGEKSGDERIFESGQKRCLVEDLFGPPAAAARFGLLARSLLADARFVRRQRLTLGEWSRFYAAQIDTYLFIEDGQDERDRLRLLRSLAKLEKMDLGNRVSGRVAAGIVKRSMESMEGGRGQYLAEGVVVSSFLPMRAIPFRVVFLLGLGEGLFPASSKRDALDLRTARRRAGDVDPSERDRYMFLETLLCARDKLYLSYVKRDEQTGDSLQPSAVVQELLHILKTGYLGEKGIKAMRIEPPLRRYDQNFDKEKTYFDEAKIEARIQELAEDWQKTEIAEKSKGKTLLIPSIKRPAEELATVRSAASPETWNILSEMLALPGEAPKTAAVTAAVRAIGLDRSEGIEAPLSLSLYDLRRFLQCPMQGWASALLGLSDEEEDLAAREEEDFEINMFTENRLLRDTLIESSGNNGDPVKLYAKKAERLRLQGAIPVGELGQIIEKRHLAILEEWQSLLLQLQDETRSHKKGPSVLNKLLRVRFGYSPGRHLQAEKTLPPLLLTLEINDERGEKRIIPVRLGGLSEALFADHSTSVILRPYKPPAGKRYAGSGRVFSYMMQALVDQVMLAAADAIAEKERQIAICYSAGKQESALQKIMLKVPEKEKALAWLESVITDLLGEAHAYLLPCEAVFGEFLKQREEEGPIRGEEINSLTAQLASDDWAKFSSLWGPVPAPRLYAPPEPEKTESIFRRRFEPLLKGIIELEGI